MPLWLGKGTFGRRLNICVEAIIGNDYSVISANIRDAVLMVHALLARWKLTLIQRRKLSPVSHHCLRHRRTRV